MTYSIRFESYGISRQLRGRRWKMTERYPSQAEAHAYVFTGAKRSCVQGASEITRIIDEGEGVRFANKRLVWHITVDTLQYEIAHGKRPWGRRTWTFVLCADKDDPQTVWAVENAPYTNALRAAKAQAARGGYHSIRVES
jgi:hypothetical protein